MKTMPRLKLFAAGLALASVFAFSANAFASPAHVAATKTSIASGAWSNPATWDTGVPSGTDDVLIGAGTTVTIDQTPITVNSLAVDGTLQYDATLRAFTVTTNLSISPGGTLQTNTAGAQTGHTLSVGGNLTNDGTLDLSTSGNTSGARLTFTGAANNTFGGAGATTDLRTLTINKGTSKANILEITTTALSVQGTVVDGTPMAFLTITNGTLKISGSFSFTGRTFASAAYSIPANGGFWLNNPNYTVSGQNGSPTTTGLLRISQGTLNIGTASGNSMGFANNAIVTVEGGAINATGRFGVNGATNNLTYAQTGGVITVCTIGNASSTLASFDLGQGVGPDVVMSGGTVIIRINSTGAPARDYRNQQGNTPSGITSTVLQFGDAGSGAAKTFIAEGLLPNVVVSNASAGHTVLFNPATIFVNNARDVTINPGCTFNIGNQAFLESGSTFTNDGTLTANGPSSRFIWFQAGGSCTYQGAGVSSGVLTSWETQTANLMMSQLSQLVARRAIIFTGNIINASKLTLGDNSATLNLVQIGNTTTPTSAGTFDVSPTFDLGTGGEQISYLRTATSRVTGVEVNPGRTLVNLSYDDNDVSHTLTVLGGDVAVSGTTALTNGRVITNANTLLADGVVTRTTGYVDGFLRKPVPVGGPVARTFEVGDAVAYSPVDVAFASVTGAGTLTGKATGGDHAQIATSGIDPGKSVNRHWTLTNSGTSFTTADAVFNFTPADIDGGANFNSFVVRKYDAPNWSAPTTGTLTSTSTQATGITSFSDFAVGELVTHTIVASAGSGGSISPSGGVSVPAGNNETFTVTADSCYAIADVKVDGVSQGPVSSYTFTNVQTGHTIEASFSASGPFTITASAGPGGSITPSGPVSVACGASQTFIIAVSDKCHSIADVKVDGVSVGPVSTYTFSDVQAHHTIAASFSNGGTFTITAGAGSGGSITPSGPVSVECGASQTYTIAVSDKCHSLADVKVDGVSVGTVSTYTFTDVQANHTIDASFATFGPFTITANAGPGGSISPSGPVSVPCGGSQTVNIAGSDKCHSIADVKVDGASVGPVSTYTFSDVQANHTIDASFGTFGPFTILATAGPGGSITPGGPVSLACGGSQTFSIAADSCSNLLDVKIDGVSVGPVASYTFADVQADRTIEATFAAKMFVLDVNTVGNGTVTKAPDQPAYACGSSVVLTANPGPGYTFIAWSGDFTGASNPLKIVLEHDTNVSATFRDITCPSVHVDLPNGGETAVIGEHQKLAWTATDGTGVTSVDLYISRDNGATYEKIASGIPNSGTFDWLVTGPGTSTSSTPVFSALFKVVAQDSAGNACEDTSDNPFAIFDLATATILSRFDATSVDDGIELRWQMTGDLVTSVSLERADHEVGPWITVDAEIRTEGEETVALDRNVKPGSSYYYRLAGRSASGQVVHFAPVIGNAIESIKVLGIASVTPNPSFGPVRIEYLVPKEVAVDLTVLDLQGRVLTVLSQGTMKEGRYHAVWNGQTGGGPVPAGVYFLRLHAAGKYVTRRIVLSR